MTIFHHEKIYTIGINVTVGRRVRVFVTVTEESHLLAWPWHGPVDEGKKKTRIGSLTRCLSHVNTNTINRLRPSSSLLKKKIKRRKKEREMIRERERERKLV